MNQTILAQPEPYNAFSVRLTGFMIENHPDRIDDADFIRSRGHQAADTFQQCSIMGMTVGQCMKEAEKVLYHGLQFSPFQLVKSIVEQEFNYTDDDDERGMFIMQMLELCRPLFNAYSLHDGFMGTYDYVVLNDRIIQCITDYLTRNGLQ